MARHRRRVVAIVLAVLVAAPAVAVFPHMHADVDPAELEATYAQPPSRFMYVDGVRTHYRDEGAGETTILLVHGTGSSLHTWQGWSDVLTRRYRVVRMDLPGFGLTGPHPEDAYDVADYVDFVEAFAGALELDRFVLAGNSLGGLVAWRYALAHPERVDRLVLVDPAGIPPKREPTLILLGKLPVVGELMGMITPLDVVRGQVENVYHDVSRIEPGTVERYHRLLLREGNRRAYREYTRSERFDVPVERVAEIDAPTLVMWGRHDRLIPVADAERYDALIPDSTVVIYEDVGHVPMEEIPERSAADVARFLAGHSL